MHQGQKKFTWRRHIAVNILVLTNKATQEVALQRARLVVGWVTVNHLSELPATQVNSATAT